MRYVHVRVDDFPIRFGARRGICLICRLCAFDSECVSMCASVRAYVRMGVCVCESMQTAVDTVNMLEH